MADNLTRDERSKLMGRVRGKNTKPEMIVRQTAHSLGFRFRLYRKDLPGRPDLVFPRLRKVVFVHGCFWHQHGCRRAALPQTNAAFWAKKLARNVERDTATLAALKEASWVTLVVWECETRNREELSNVLSTFLAENALEAFPPFSTK